MAESRRPASTPTSHGGDGGATKPDKPRGGFRRDIEGLRALAVLSVMFWHAGVGGVNGGFVGVDSFFVISGFLMTLILTRELATTGRISLRAFYARRARRLLPAATLTLIAIVIAARTLFDASRWAAVAWDSAWAAVYGANWRFIHQSTDYMARDEPPSPVQHFWSLSVEEQFYALLPVLLVVCFFLVAGRRSGARRYAVSAQRAATLVVGTAFVLSLTWSITQTPSHLDRSYFSTWTRVWELALGGIVALILMRPPSQQRTPKWLTQLLAIAAAVTLIATMLRLSDLEPFPGWRALLPTVATAVLIWTGARDAGTITNRLLSNRVLVWIGSLSYSLYLWHWPVLAFGHEVLHPATPLTTLEVFQLFALTFAIAWASYLLVENPIRRKKLSNTATLAIAGAVTAVTVLIAASVSLETIRRDRNQQSALRAAPGAAVLPDPIPPGYQPTVRELLPTTIQDPATFYQSARPDYWRSGCYVRNFRPGVQWCPFGDLASPRKLFLIGDSHAGMWAGAVDVAAKRLGMNGTMAIKHECGFADVEQLLHGQPNSTCLDWTREVTRQVVRIHPDAVILATRATYPVADQTGHPLTGDAAISRYAKGLAKTWKQLTDAGIPVYVISPVSGFEGAFKCAIRNHGDGRKCGFSRAKFARPGRVLLQDALHQAPAVRPVDLIPILCPRTECLPVMGGLYVMNDRSHISRYFSESMGGHLATLLRGAGIEATKARP